jgi:hypothetical protein
MFDSYCIPNIPVESRLYFEVQEQLNAPFSYSVAQIKAYINDVAAQFMLEPEELNKKHATGRPVKLLAGVNIPFIRMIIVKNLDNSGEYRDEDLANALEISRPSISNLRKSSKILYEVKDSHFMKYVQRINRVSINGVCTEPLVLEQ